MKKIKDYIVEWGSLFYSKNPYGKQIPDKYLFSETLLRKYDREGNKVQYKNLSEMRQDGWCISNVKQGSMEDEWEKEEVISFSPIFHRLVESNSLCPANYVVHIVEDLQKFDLEHGVPHNEEFYIGTIARGLRAFASYVREQNLTETIDEILSKSANIKNVQYRMFQSSVNQDMKFKTDIMFSYNNEIYRAWSYQTTARGIERTSGRVLRANGRGYNVLFPFNIRERKEVSGWFLYDENIVRHTLIDLIVANKKPILIHSEYCDLVNENPYIIKKPSIFYVE